MQANEALPLDGGQFDVVTIGRALHWMASATAALFNRLVAPGGAILVCTSNSAADGRNPWLEEFNRAQRSLVRMRRSRGRIWPRARHAPARNALPCPRDDCRREHP